MDKFTLSTYIVQHYEGTTPMKLQKLLYYCYVWQLVAGKKSFEANFEAWQHGPVEPDIYYKYKHFGREPITDMDFISAKPAAEIHFILESYAVLSAIELSKTTHLENPWKKYVKEGGRIPDQELTAFYQQQPFAWNFPLNNKTAQKYYPPKTAGHYAFTFDMKKDYVPEYSSLEEYLEGVKTAKKQLNEIAFESWHCEPVS